MNWAVFACVLGAMYVLLFGRLLYRHGLRVAAGFAGLLHVVFATANSAAPFRALLDDMYMGWQIGLLRFEGRAAVLPSSVVLMWALASAWLCARRAETPWMRLVAWGDVFWVVNISTATLWAVRGGSFEQASIQFGEYFQVGGIWVALLLVLGTMLLFGPSAVWAHRQASSAIKSSYGPAGQ
jgi:hypothetical protein